MTNVYDSGSIGDALTRQGISRRSFLQFCTSLASLMALPAGAAQQLAAALAKARRPSVIWLSFQECTGCTESLIRSSHPTVGNLILDMISLDYHETLMVGSGHQAEKSLHDSMLANKGKYILVVEGAIPMKDNGIYCKVGGKTALDSLKKAADGAAAIIAIGTCASYGGISGANPNPTGIKSVSGASNVSTINIPGCPVHPDWVIWTIAQLLAGTTPSLDAYRRPTAFFGATVHSKCPRRSQSWATSLSQTGLCMGNLGCKGSQTYGDCPTRKWNNGVNWCVAADSLCQGCTQSTFPDKFAPLFSTMGATPLSGHPTVSSPRTTCTSCHGQNVD